MNAIAANAVPILRSARTLQPLQFSLLELFGWTTFAAVMVALFRAEPVFGVLFVLWGLPGILRFQATVRIRNQPVELLGRTGTFIGCLFVAAACSMIAGVIVTILLCPLFAILSGIASILKAYNWEYPTDFSLCMSLLAIYLLAFNFLRRITWPDRMNW